MSNLRFKVVEEAFKKQTFRIEKFNSLSQPLHDKRCRGGRGCSL